MKKFINDKSTQLFDREHRIVFVFLFIQKKKRYKRL